MEELHGCGIGLDCTKKRRHDGS